MDLSEEERMEINKAVNQLLLAYHHDDHLLIRLQIELLNHATHTLAENMMNTAVRGALKGTKI
jgi:molecular chaperone DnaK